MSVAEQQSRTDPEQLLARVQELSEQVERLDDPRARELAAELVSSVIAMYGDGLARIMSVIHGSREAGATILDELTQDGAVASLLLIHDLYPVGLRERVQEALDTVRPYMESHGGDVELLALTDEGVARLALQGSCHGCAASRATLETAITQALAEHCPDLAGIEVEGVVEESAVSSITGMALPMADADLSAAAAALPTEPVRLPVMQPSGAGPAPGAGSPAAARWTELDDGRRPARDATRALEIAGRSVLLADVGGTLLAYIDECAACGEPLHDGTLEAPMLRCGHCGVEFDLPRAGRAAGGEPLRPLPLLDNAPALRVAV
jgi:Fe-S cluster biogenesis protein NfuA/nitrite reductase/ring-hydroxylating ferredoxin subunit